MAKDPSKGRLARPASNPCPLGTYDQITLADRSNWFERPLRLAREGSNRVCSSESSESGASVHFGVLGQFAREDDAFDGPGGVLRVELQYRREAVLGARPGQQQVVVPGVDALDPRHLETTERAGPRALVIVDADGSHRGVDQSWRRGTR